MSLLIKALDKAEKALEEQQKVEQAQSQKNTRRRAKNIANHAADASLSHEKLSLEPHPHDLTQEFFSANYVSDSNSARAANVFDAKQSQSKGMSSIAWIGLLGLFSLLAIGAYFYYQLNQLQSPTPQTSVVSNTQPAPVTQAGAVTAASSQPLPPAEVTQPSAPLANNLSAESNPVPTESESAQLPDQANIAEAALMPEEINLSARHSVKRKQTRPKNDVDFSETFSVNSPSASAIYGDNSAPMIASKSASMKVVKSNKQTGANPTILSAYNAYNAGNFSQAKTLYRDVLHRDARNVDALLGMGAIAEIEGRQQDSLSWYQKVLEVEPKNSIALTAFYEHENDDGNRLQKYKNLIAKEPNNANTYADLGAYYAEQNLWPEAQDAYFEAYRLNISAENALNLAISLDQMDKPKLALPYYQQALELVSNASPNTINQEEIQARIVAIQAN